MHPSWILSCIACKISLLGSDKQLSMVLNRSEALPSEPECSRSNTKLAVRLQDESMPINSAPHWGVHVVG